jgi:hypothetical protein
VTGQIAESVCKLIRSAALGPSSISWPRFPYPRLTGSTCGEKQGTETVRALGLDQTRVTKRTYCEGINPCIRTESQTTSFLKAVTLVSQFRNSASAKSRRHDCCFGIFQGASEQREGA